MNEKWEINRVSTPERIFNKINNEMTQPVCIVLFGVDCDLKDKIHVQCRKQISRLDIGYRSALDVFSRSIQCWFDMNVNVLVSLTGAMSSDHEQRHRVITTARELGAQSVIGIYAKPQKGLHARWANDGSGYKVDELVRQVQTLTANPPTADGLDYFVVVEEKEE